MDKKSENKKAVTPFIAPLKTSSSVPPGEDMTKIGAFPDVGPSADPAMNNRPDEPAFKCHLDMNKVEFPPTTPGKPVSVVIRMHNPQMKRVGFKIRCTSAEIFRVHPPVGLIGPLSTYHLTIWYTTTADKAHEASKKHFFAFYHKTLPTTAERPLISEVWREGLKGYDGVRRIPVVFSQ